MAYPYSSLAATKDYIELEQVISSFMQPSDYYKRIFHQRAQDNEDFVKALRESLLHELRKRLNNVNTEQVIIAICNKKIVGAVILTLSSDGLIGSIAQNLKNEWGPNHTANKNESAYKAVRDSKGGHWPFYSK